MEKSTREACAKISPLRWGWLDFHRSLGYTPIAMELSHIVFLKSVNPITIIDDPSNRSKEAVLKFIKDEWFENWVLTIRKHLNLPENGADIRLVEGKYLFEPTVAPHYISIFLQLFPKQLIDRYGLAEDFMVNITLMVYFNAFIALEYFQGFVERDFEFVPTKALTAYKLHTFKHEVGTILIPYHSSKRKLKDWIDKNWDNVEKQMDEHLFEGTGILEMHKNTVLGEEIDTLLKQVKTYPKVATKLIDKYPEDKRLADPEQVRIMHKRYIDDLASFAKQFPTEQ